MNTQFLGSSWISLKILGDTELLSFKLADTLQKAEIPQGNQKSNVLLIHQPTGIFFAM
jgi:hypothetical protein